VGPALVSGFMLVGACKALRIAMRFEFVNLLIVLSDLSTRPSQSRPGQLHVPAYLCLRGCSGLSLPGGLPSRMHGRYAIDAVFVLTVAFVAIDPHFAELLIRRYDV
jgi:hypothetical protein